MDDGRGTLVLRGITKILQNLVATDRIDRTILTGEIHTLLVDMVICGFMCIPLVGMRYRP